MSESGYLNAADNAHEFSQWMTDNPVLEWNQHSNRHTANRTSTIA